MTPPTIDPGESSYHYVNILSRPLFSNIDDDLDIIPLPIQGIEGKGKGKAKEEKRSLDLDQLYYRTFEKEDPDLYGIMGLCEQELSEPYNLYTFRYFLQDWPHLTFLVFPDRTSNVPIGTIVCKQDTHRGKTNRGYIAMLSVDKGWRRRGIASQLVRKAIEEMVKRGADEVVLETEFDNSTSIALYERLGFIREKRLYRFYSNGKDAFRLILPLPARSDDPDDENPTETPEEAEAGRWAIGCGPDGLSVIPEEDRYFPEELGINGRDTPRPLPPPIPPRPSERYDELYT